MTDKRAMFAAFALLSVATIAVVARVAYLPTHDGPQHLFLAYLVNHFDDPSQSYKLYLEPGTPVTNLGFTALFSTLEAMLGWHAAYRVALSVMVMVWAWSCVWLAWAVGRPWLGLVGFVTACGWPLFMGFFSHVLSLSIGFFLIGLALRQETYDARARVLLLLTWAAQAAVHVFGALVSGLVLFLLVVFGHANKHKLREIGWLTLMSVPTIVILWMLRGAPAVEASTVWLGPLDQLWLAPRLLLGGPWWRAVPAVLLAVAGVAMAARRWRVVSAGERALSVASALFWIAAVATPLHLVSWGFFSPRFLPVAAVFGAVLVPYEAIADVRVRRALLAALAIHAGATLAWTWHFVGKVESSTAEAFAAMGSGGRRTGPRLSIVFDPYAGLADGFADSAAAWSGVDMPYYAPLHNLGMVYALEQGGFPSHLFATNPRLLAYVQSGRALPPLFTRDSLRDPQVLADPAQRRELVIWLAMLGRPFEDVLLYGEPSDVNELAARGYTPSYRSERLIVGRFEGCTLRVAILVGAGGAPILMEHGTGNLGTPPRPITNTTVQRNGLLCGESWLRISLDRDRSGGPSDGDGFCRGSDREAKLQFVLEPRAAAVRCEL